MCYGHLAQFVNIWCIFSILVYFTKENLATLMKGLILLYPLIWAGVKNRSEQDLQFPQATTFLYFLPCRHLSPILGEKKKVLRPLARPLNI
jgi:hypothetical protein